jgi:hypothetical protein
VANWKAIYLVLTEEHWRTYDIQPGVDPSNGRIRLEKSGAVASWSDERRRWRRYGRFGVGKVSVRRPVKYSGELLWAGQAAILWRSWAKGIHLSAGVLSGNCMGMFRQRVFNGGNWRASYGEKAYCGLSNASEPQAG